MRERQQRKLRNREEPLKAVTRRGEKKRPVRRNDEAALSEKKGNVQIMILTYSIVLIFLGMIGYLTYFMVNDSERVINNPYNKRQQVLAEKITRGSIYSADKKVLARTVTDSKGNETREYPYDNMFCHVVGRISNSMTGVERAQGYPLLTCHMNPFLQIANTFKGNKNPGDNVVTTLNAALQETAYHALGNYKGAVVALEPSTGKILAMVSKPDYNPNTVTDNWESIANSSESVLVNRATQGLYPPGSTFKILTAAEYIREHKDDYRSYSFQCQGHASFEGNEINCYGGEQHGTLNLKKSLAKSCNTSFANIGTKLNIKSFQKLCEKFMFNKEIPVNFEYNKSKFLLTPKSDKGELVQTVIGQGKTTITPLQNAMIVSAIANGGEMMIPYVTDHLENDSGRVVKTYKPSSNGKVIDKATAKILKNMMMEVVKSGTGSKLSDLSYNVAGKTGSAEFDSQGTSHAWFVGYAPANNPEIAVSIVVEGAGTGSQYAVPIAKKMFQEYLGY